MRIVTLIENTSGCPGCACEHGLSFYIETGKHKVLADTGASSAFLDNARILGIDLQQVDTVVISHGHYDHAGGVMDFAKLNPQARIYLQRSAGGAFYHLKEAGDKYIGMDPRILKLPQLCLTEGEMTLDEELFLFSGVCGRLMCCLKNEQETYEELNKKLPGTGDTVTLPDGLQGTVQSVNVLRQQVKVIVEINDEKVIQEYPAGELKFRPRKKKVKVSEKEMKELKNLEDGKEEDTKSHGKKSAE